MSLASRTASSSSVNGTTASTGPKISSRAIVMLVVDLGEDRRGDEVAGGEVAVDPLAAADQARALVRARGSM